jgi:predicted ArsR family transcriptional regulator
MNAREADFLEEAGFTPLRISIYDAIIESPKTRDEIVQKLQTPRTTVFDSLKFLEKRGLVARRPIYHFGPMKRGRPRVEFYLVGRDDRS